MNLQKTFAPGFLTGKTALITGGHRGMLYTIAQELLRFGAKVAIMSRNEENIKKAVNELNTTFSSQNCMGVRCDVRNYKEICDAVDKVIEKFGKIDVVVNGAAGNFLAPVDKLSPNGFKTVLEIDTMGTFNVSKAVYEKCMKKNGGNIVNISATLHYNSASMMTHAVAAKAGVDALTRNLAVEFGPYNIRVNGVAPGPIEGTEGMDRLKDPNAKTNDFNEFIPLGRIGLREEIASAVLFLVSDVANYITGHTLVVDGGQVLTTPNFPILYPEYRKMWRAKL